MSAPTTPAGTRRDRLDLFAVAVMTTICMFMGFGHVAIKFANQGMTPFFQGGLRSLLAAVLIGLWCRWRGIGLAFRDGTWLPALLASFFFALEFALLYPGLERTTASRAVVFLYTSPFVVAVGAHFLLPGDRLTLNKVFGLCLAFAGVVVVLLGRETGGQASLLGDLLCLGGGISWGCLTLVMRATRLASVPPEKGVFVQHLFTAAALLGLSLLVGEAGLKSPSLLHWGAFAWTVIFVAFLSFLTGYWLMLTYPASRIMAFMLLTPVFGVFAGVLVLGEPLTLALLAGLALVILGLWFVNRPVSLPRAVPVAPS